MVDLKRLMRSLLYFCIGIMLSAISAFSLAETIPATNQVLPAVHVYSPTQLSDQMASCEQNNRTQYGSRANDYKITGVEPGTIAGKYSCLGYWIYGSTTPSKIGEIFDQWICGTTISQKPKAPTCAAALGCPTDQSWTLTGNTCTRPDCDPGQTRDPQGICVVSDPCLSKTEGQTFSQGLYDMGTDPNAKFPNVVCANGCIAAFNGSAPARTSIVSGKTHYYGVGGYYYFGGPGMACTAGQGPVAPPTALTSAPPTTCGVGQGTASMNGKTICVSTSTGQPTNPIVPPGDPGTIPLDPGTPGDPGNATPTTPGGTPGGTGTTPGGPGTKPGTPDPDPDPDPDPAFCEENPDSPVCIKSKFSGACSPGASPSCDGDAVQCAQATAAWKLECQLNTEPDDAAFKLGKSIAGGGSDPNGNPLSDDKETKIDVGVIVSQAANQRTLTGTCIAPPHFSVMGHSYSFDTTNFCKFAEIVGFLMVAASSVISVRMVASGG